MASTTFGKALAKLEQYLPTYHAIETQVLVDRVRQCLHDAELTRDGGRGFDETNIPQIQFCEIE
ncbi:MAG: hypothetical protein AAB393_19650 [Bacteroidota bacterium]